MISFIALFILLYAWFGFWSAQAGGSMTQFGNRLQKWQDGHKLLGKVPEAIIAATFASIGVWGWNAICAWLGYDLKASTLIALWVLFTAVSYAGKESATWAYLNWGGHTKDKNGDGIITAADGRNSTLYRFNTWFAKRLGFKLGKEGFSWVWAFTKGFITSAPVLFTACIFQPIGREIASHAKDRLKGDPNFYMEAVGDGFGYAASCAVFITVLCTL